MAGRNIVIGQAVDSVKVQRAKELRKEMTPEEKVLWQHLRGNRLHGLHFRRQQIIDGFIVDFYCHAAGLVVEVDGSAHDDRAEYDTERDQLLTARGLQVVRVTNDEVRAKLSEVLARIENVTKQLIAPGSSGRRPARSPFPSREGG